jgi:hypothetical protein
VRLDAEEPIVALLASIGMQAKNLRQGPLDYANAMRPPKLGAVATWTVKRLLPH